MAWASMLAGIPNAQVGTVLAHALGQTVGGYCGAPHGKALAACLAPTMRFGLIGSLEKFARVAEAMDTGSTHLPLRERAEKSVELVQRLLRDCGAEATFADCGLEEKDVDKVTEITLRLYPGNLSSNPREVTPESLRGLYKECLG